MSRISMLVLDVDGTMNDGKIYISDVGESFKCFDIKDGYGIYRLLPDNGISPVVITGRKSMIVVNRCRELGIKDIYQGCLDKRELLLNIAKNKGMEVKDGIINGCAYIGDDLIDLPAMGVSEIVGCPANAVSEVKIIADFISTKNGGDGAVREFIEWLIENHLS